MGLCTSCGNRAAPGTRLCPVCGAPLDSEPAAAARLPSDPARIVVASAFAVLAAVAAGAFAAVLQAGTQPARLGLPGRPAAARPHGPSAPAAPGVPTGPGRSPRPPGGRSGSPAPTTGTGPAPVRATGTSVVAIGPGAAYQPHAAAVAAVLTDYFADINHRDFRAYRNLLTAGLRRIETRERIRSGYQSTADSGVTVVRLTATGGGRLLAAVAFVSHQAPADSPDRSGCDNWRVTLDLVPHQGGYLIGGPPPGHQASYRPCP